VAEQILQINYKCIYSRTKKFCICTSM